MSERTPTPGPWTPGGYFYSSDGPTRMNIWAPRAKPEHQSGPCVARDVLECDVPLICAVHDLRTALVNLSNEVLGSLPLMEALARQQMGNTNYNILIQRAEEARTVLAKAKSS